MLLLLLALQQAPGITVIEAVTPACGDCEITIVRLASLGSEADAEIPADLASVTRDSEGNFYVVSSMIRQPVFKYSSTGKLLKLIGRDGEGPGEFRWAREVKVWGDTLHVVDVVLARLSLFTLEGGLIDTHPFPLGTDGITRLGSEYVVFSKMAAPSHAGLPLHHVGRDGAIDRSFGALEPTTDPEDPYSRFRWLAPSGDSAVWAAFVNRYEITLWSLSGRPLLTFERDVSWFRDWKRREGRADMFEPPPRLECVREDDDGNILTLIHVPDRNWNARRKEAVTDRELRVLPDSELGWYYDTVIEVVRIADGQLLATRRLDEYLSCYLANGQNLYTSRRSGDHGTAVHVWTVDLRHTGGGR